MPLVGSPTIGAIAPDAKGLYHRFERQKEGAFRRPNTKTKSLSEKVMRWQQDASPSVESWRF
jgi:hypothetical protein